MSATGKMSMFQRAPTLGGECYASAPSLMLNILCTFQRAPTLGGECYNSNGEENSDDNNDRFQRAPTLGGECYGLVHTLGRFRACGFNGHPPLGVNATSGKYHWIRFPSQSRFQRAPTLGGECYYRVSSTRARRQRMAFQRAPTLGGECYRELQ